MRLADGDRFLLTPTYHVFEMFTPHMGAQSVRTVFSSPKATYDRNGKPADFWGLNGSASVNGKQLTLTVTNSHMSEPREAEIQIRGARIASAKARVISAKDVHAHNTFENPQAVESHDEQVRTARENLVFRFPPVSATRWAFDLQ
jgi:alpha-N-arabinofuranosidase